MRVHCLKSLREQGSGSPILLAGVMATFGKLLVLSGFLVSHGPL